MIVAVVLSAVGFPLEGTASAIVNNLSNALLFISFGWFGYVIATRATEAQVQPAGAERQGSL